MAHGCWPMGQNRLCQFSSVANFCLKLTLYPFEFQIQNDQKYTRCQFFHKIYPLRIWIWKSSKLVHFGLIGRQPHLLETTRNVKPQILELAIFVIKRTLFQFWFSTGNWWKYLKSVHYGPIGWSLFGHNAQKYGSPNTGINNFFHKTDPFKFGFLK